MINAVLVFNNSGQPRLTKFYTQLVRARVCIRIPLETNIYTGYECPTTPDLRDLHPCL